MVKLLVLVGSLAALFGGSLCWNNNPQRSIYHPRPTNPYPYNPRPINPNPFNPRPINPQPFNPRPVHPHPFNPRPINPQPPEPEDGDGFFASETSRFKRDFRWKREANDEQLIDFEEINAYAQPMEQMRFRRQVIHPTYRPPPTRPSRPVWV